MTSFLTSDLDSKEAVVFGLEEKKEKEKNKACFPLLNWAICVVWATRVAQFQFSF